MPDRHQLLLRRVCLVLAVVLVLRLGFAVFRPNPLARLTIPALPTLASPTNAAPAGAAAKPPAIASSTNTVAGTNAMTGIRTNAIAGTNIDVGSNPASTNKPAVAGLISTTNAPSGTNIVSTNLPSTNAPAIAGSTNSPGKAAAPMAGPPPGMMPPGMMPPGMMGGRGMMAGPAGPPPPLDPLLKARVDKIIQSEIFGPIPRPVPMALLGIAGPLAFIRTPSGMPAVISEGVETNGIKLLRIGINRVLVDEGGTNKELTIFNGVGGESLLPKPTSSQP